MILEFDIASSNLNTQPFYKVAKYGTFASEGTMLNQMTIPSKSILTKCSQQFTLDITPWQF